MSISSIGGCGAATQTQATQYRSTTSASSATAASNAIGVAQDGSSFINAIASVLSDMGVRSTSSADSSTQFLQTLSAKLEASGPSGNLINTTA